MDITNYLIDIFFVNQQLTVSRFYEKCPHLFGKFINLHTFYFSSWNHKFPGLSLREFERIFQWNQLESFERDIANFYEVKVKIVVLFEGRLTVLPTGATVPSGFVKIIEFNGQKHTFNFPNIDTKGTDWIDYKVN